MLLLKYGSYFLALLMSPIVVSKCLFVLWRIRQLLDLFLCKWRWPTAKYLNARIRNVPTWKNKIINYNKKQSTTLTTLILFYNDFFVLSLYFFTRRLASFFAASFLVLTLKFLYKLLKSMVCWLLWWLILAAFMRLNPRLLLISIIWFVHNWLLKFVFYLSPLIYIYEEP